jgi:hypothetical protein
MKPIKNPKEGKRVGRYLSPSKEDWEKSGQTLRIKTEKTP